MHKLWGRDDGEGGCKKCYRLFFSVERLSTKMPPLRGFSVRLGTAFYEDVTPLGLFCSFGDGFLRRCRPLGLCLVMAKAEGVIRSTQPHAEAWG
ncbi:MAG: hypothetical protein J0L94_15000 [Rhodothermia bacterium]|nr:hypothetical protein [Rhodothermia bacterium]